MLEIFKNSLKHNSVPSCPACRADSNIEDIIHISKYIIQRFRANSETPKASIRECPYLYLGYVTEKDLTFGKIIRHHELTKSEEGILPLIQAIIEYTHDFF